MIFSKTMLNHYFNQGVCAIFLKIAFSLFVALTWLIISVFSIKAYADLPKVVDLYQPSSHARDQKDKPIKESHTQHYPARPPFQWFTKKPASLKTTSVASNHTIIPEKQWQTAHALVKAKQYQTAIEALRLFIRQFKNHAYTARAHYLLGQLALLNNDPTQSIQYFQQFIKKYPNDKRVTDARFQIGLAYYAKHNNMTAYKYFRQLQKTHPNHPTAQKAAIQLKQLHLLPKAL